MTQADKVNEARRAPPFRPFRISISDGRSFLVDHPEFLFVTRNGRTVILETPEEHVVQLDTMLVTGLEFAKDG